MTRMLLADVLPLEVPQVYDHLYCRASAARRALADSFRFGKDRRLSIGAAALLDAGLAACGFRERDMSYGYTANGKPFFINAPEICFSISHSGSKVAVALSDAEVGCDIEEIAQIDMAVAERFFCRDEYEHLMSLDLPEERSGEFFRIWTLKESYMKATGLGMALAPDTFSVYPGLPDSGVEFISPASFPGYACALCYKPSAGIPQVSFVGLARLAE